MKVKLASLSIVAGVLLGGCASAPQLGQADTRGFNAGGTTVLVEYIPPKDQDATAGQLAELREQRRAEVHQLLQGHGFRPVTDGQAAFRMQVVEGDANDVTGEWKGALGANLVIFTLGVVPAMFDYRAEMQYELWSKDKRVHAIKAPASWKEAVGLVSLSSTLSGADAGRQKARIGAHDSVIRLWIDQGSFEQ